MHLQCLSCQSLLCHCVYSGWGSFALLIFSAAHNISWTFNFWTPKIPPVTHLGWVDFFGSNDSQINPHMRAKFDCSQTVVSKKGGYRQTDTQRDAVASYSRYHSHLHVLSTSSFLPVVSNPCVSSWPINAPMAPKLSALKGYRRRIVRHNNSL